MTTLSPNRPDPGAASPMGGTLHHLVLDSIALVVDKLANSGDPRERHLLLQRLTRLEPLIYWQLFHLGKSPRQDLAIQGDRLLRLLLLRLAHLRIFGDYQVLGECRDILSALQRFLQDWSTALPEVADYTIDFERLWSGQ
ncbi:MAG: hypothetical protein ACP5D5_09400 [Acidithiobacillus sp.]|uniref:hypothetical protein n=1 Tax=Acidithiobacillus sp. TaxID=1872118 RepID=UPI003CFF7931